MARFFPRVAARKAATTLISRRILQKIETGEAVDKADIEFAKARFSEEEVKWMRRQEVAFRTVKILEVTNPPKLLQPLNAMDETSATQGFGGL